MNNDSNASADRLSRMQAFERSHEEGANTSDNPLFADVVDARFHRRDLLKTMLGLAAGGVLGGLGTTMQSAPAEAQAERSFAFEEIDTSPGDNHAVAAGHEAEVLIRWGDPVLPGAPVFDPYAQTAEAQKLQFGYNNDFLGYFPLPGGNPSEHGLLVANHEYTNEELMFPGLGRQDRGRAFAGMTPELVAIEMAAHGGSVVEVRRESGKWRVVANSRYARRIHADTPMQITGPAAGDPRMRTSADPEGRRVLGMLNNCAGGVTPWGTWLSGEENIHGYFWGKLDEASPEARNHKRFVVPSNAFAWGIWHPRFNVEKELNEPNRFGWVVEIDPFDPTSTPKKRTALGRFKHEGAAGIINRDGRYVIYLGDDERSEYVYRFVSAGRVDPANRAANLDLLDSGTLAVARFNADGSLDWLPLVHGTGPLTAANGLHSQADVLIEARWAADLLGATKMDRPEDIEANAATGKVYVMLTFNERRTPEQVNAANPRAHSRFGHIIEMIPPDKNHSADRFRWEILVRCGDPANPAIGATFHPETSKNGWFGMPDNLAIDGQGRLWVATDGNSASRTGRTDGLWAMETEGPLRGLSRAFFRVPSGAELCGPFFTPNDETLFVAIQHPGEADENDPNATPATFEQPSTRWPDFDPKVPPRPAVVVITRKGGGKIAS